MKRPALALSMAATITLAGPVRAGPPPGHHYFNESTFMRKTGPRPRPSVAHQNNSALPQAAKFRWKPEFRWAGGHKYRRIIRTHKPIN